MPVEGFLKLFTSACLSLLVGNNPQLQDGEKGARGGCRAAWPGSSQVVRGQAGPQTEGVRPVSRSCHRAPRLLLPCKLQC